MLLGIDLIKCLCDTEEEIGVKFVRWNDSSDSLIKFMNDFCQGYKHVCGYSLPQNNYFLVDIPLNGAIPDILFEHSDIIKGKPYVSRIYGYLVSE